MHAQYFSSYQLTFSHKQSGHHFQQFSTVYCLSCLLNDTVSYLDYMPWFIKLCNIWDKHCSVAVDSRILGCDAISMGKQPPTAARSSSSSHSLRIMRTCRWRCHNPSKHQQPLAQWQTITSCATWTSVCPTLCSHISAWLHKHTSTYYTSDSQNLILAQPFIAHSISYLLIFTTVIESIILSS